MRPRCPLAQQVLSVPGLRGLSLRLPQPDSGPPLRPPHLSALCGRARRLTRLALLLGPGADCSRLEMGCWLHVGRDGGWVWGGGLLQVWWRGMGGWIQRRL